MINSCSQTGFAHVVFLLRIFILFFIFGFDFWFYFVSCLVM